MIAIKGKQGSALYTVDPYPDWIGDDAMITVGEKLRIQSQIRVVEKGLFKGPERVAQLFNAFKEVVEETDGVTITAFRIPEFDEDLDDPTIVR